MLNRFLNSGKGANNNNNNASTAETSSAITAGSSSSAEIAPNISNPIIIEPVKPYNQTDLQMLGIIQRAYVVALANMVATANNKKASLAIQDRETKMREFLVSQMNLEYSELGSPQTISLDGQMAAGLLNRLPDEFRLTQVMDEGILYSDYKPGPLVQITPGQILGARTWSSQVTGDLKALIQETIEIAEGFLKRSYSQNMLNKRATNPKYLTVVYLMKKLMQISQFGYSDQKALHFITHTIGLIQQLMYSGEDAYILGLGDSIMSEAGPKSTSFIAFLSKMESKLQIIAMDVYKESFHKGAAEKTKKIRIALMNAIRISVRAKGILSNEEKVELDNLETYNELNKKTPNRNTLNTYQRAILTFLDLMYASADEGAYVDEVVKDWLRVFETKANASSSSSSSSSASIPEATIAVTTLRSNFNEAQQGKKIDQGKINAELDKNLVAFTALYKAIIDPAATNPGVDEPIIHNERGLLTQPLGVIWRWFSLFYILTLTKKVADQVKAFETRLKYLGEVAIFLMDVKNVDLFLGGAVPTIKALHKAQTEFIETMQTYYRTRTIHGSMADINVHWSENYIRSLPLYQESNTLLLEAQKEIEELIELANEIQSRPNEYMMSVAKSCVEDVARAQYNQARLSVFFKDNEMKCITQHASNINPAVSVALGSATNTNSTNNGPATITHNNLREAAATANNPSSGFFGSLMPDFFRSLGSGQSPTFINGLSATDRRHIEHQNRQATDNIQQNLAQERWDFVTNGAASAIQGNRTSNFRIEELDNSSDNNNNTQAIVTQRKGGGGNLKPGSSHTQF